MCAVMNNGQNEIGSGGNGGAIYSDGNSVNVTLCGDAILNNAAGASAFGGGAVLHQQRHGRHADHHGHDDGRQHWRPLDQASAGSVTNAGTAVGATPRASP